MSHKSEYGNDEFEFEEDYDDYMLYDRDQEDQEESDEDTEEASETEMGKNEEYSGLKEQIYQDKLGYLKKQLELLKDGSHTEFNKKLKKLGLAFKERIRLNGVTRDYLIEWVERDFHLEKNAAAKEFDEKKIELRENLLSDMEEKKKLIESERHTMELTGDSMEVKPVMTRKLRRRPNDPVPIPEKRRKAPQTQLNYLLDEKDIDTDLKHLSRIKMISPVRKPVMVNSTSNMGTNLNSDNLPDTRVEDGKLLFEKRWYHRGQPIYVEGKDFKYAAVISAVSNDVIWVKKVSDNIKVKIYIAHLARGKYSIKRRAS